MEFEETLRQYYADFGRHDLPWRQPEPDGAFNPYKILVSEIMLQQTQVPRVLIKFNEFLLRFPTVQSLAVAELGDVLQVWSGLGYNRRAKFLWQAAQKVHTDFGGALPQTLEELVLLPGVGKNTAGAVMAYAFDEPVVFLETNIRTVYIHHFFHDEFDVPDAAIAELVDTTLDRQHPREFYWALMDYGTYLKQTVGNASRQAKGYAKQSKFEGSKRQVRGQVLRELAAGPQSVAALAQRIPDERLPEVLQDLVKEGMLKQEGDNYAI